VITSGNDIVAEAGTIAILLAGEKIEVVAEMKVEETNGR